MPKEESYFVKINNQSDSRKIILENTRDTLKALQGYEDFRRIRQKRTLLINSFKIIMSDVRSMILDMKRILPKTNVKDIKPFVTEERSVPELRRIEQELADIESKLNTLS